VRLAEGVLGGGGLLTPGSDLVRYYGRKPLPMMGTLVGSWITTPPTAMVQDFLDVSQTYATGGCKTLFDNYGRDILLHMLAHGPKSAIRVEQLRHQLTVLFGVRAHL